MKKFLKKRWHGIPVGIVSALLALVLVTGSVFAAYGFLTATVEVKVEEAIVVGVGTWDNLEPYGLNESSLDDVNIVISECNGNPVFTITTIPGYAGEGFVAGEIIVIPVNLRNAGDGTLSLGASVFGGGGNLLLECSFEENLGPETSNESGQAMCREYKAVGVFGSLDEWTGEIGPLGGKSGSAVVGAEVLFVKISAPGDVIPGTYTYTVILERG